jgi:hypothetical protein
MVVVGGVYPLHPNHTTLSPLGVKDVLMIGIMARRVVVAPQPDRAVRVLSRSDFCHPDCPAIALVSGHVWRGLLCLQRRHFAL